MQCPMCRSQSVRMEKGSKVCGAKGCTYIDVHPISFDNDVMHYEGEDKKENRFSALFSACLSGGGIELEKEANFDKSYKKGRKYISDWCFQLKHNQNIIDTATARFLTILRIMAEEKEAKERELDAEDVDDDNGEDKTKKKERHKNIFSIKNMAAYSIYSACFEKQNYFQEFYLSIILDVSAQYWKSIVKDMNSMLKSRIDFVPIVKPMHLIVRVCGRRKVKREERRAMIQMCDNIQAAVHSDIRINTVAALAFWKVCEYSSVYKDKFVLNDFCKNHEKLEEEGAKVPVIQGYFDVTPDNVRKVFKEHVKPVFGPKIMPNFEGRLPLREIGKIQDD